jgi:hypothetical protein
VPLRSATIIVYNTRGLTIVMRSIDNKAFSKLITAASSNHTFEQRDYYRFH